MDLPDVEIRHGEFIDLDGPAKTFGEITFAPARVELHGYDHNSASDLQHYLEQAEVSAEIKALVRPGDDAPWVRGRAQRLFFVPNTTEEDRPEKTCFCAAFIALIRDSGDKYFGVPFECMDYYCKTTLYFSEENGPPISLQQRIAAAFWGLLLSDPTDVDDYRDSFFHSGAGVMIDFGIDDGEPFIEERPESD